LNFRFDRLPQSTVLAVKHDGHQEPDEAWQDQLQQVVPQVVGVQVHVQRRQLVHLQPDEDERTEEQQAGQAGADLIKPISDTIYNLHTGKLGIIVAPLNNL
jgi:hypothetical protein